MDVSLHISGYMCLHFKSLRVIVWSKLSSYKLRPTRSTGRSVTFDVKLTPLIIVRLTSDGPLWYGGVIYARIPSPEEYARDVSSIPTFQKTPSAKRLQEAEALQVKTNYCFQPCLMDLPGSSRRASGRSSDQQS